MSAPVLLIAHEATRTGGPRAVLEVLRRIRDELPGPLAVQLIAEGPLAGELRDLATTNHLGERPLIVLVNGAQAAAEAAAIEESVPAMVWVHEQGEALDVLPPRTRRALRERFERVLAVSAAAVQDLVELGVPEERIVVVPPAVAPPRPARREEAIALRRELVMPHDAPLVLACGEAGWRKGADLFVDVARLVNERRTVHFVWAGRRPRAFARVLDNDTRAAAVGHLLHWVGEVEDLSVFYLAADLLVMPSREDPQPLVPLEAALCGTATTAFAVGGLEELGAANAAAVVPYPDVVALADSVLTLLSDSGRRAGLVARGSARATGQAPDTVARKLLEQLLDMTRGVTT